MSRSGRSALVLASFVALVACGGGADQQAQTKAGDEQAAGQQAQATKQAQRGPDAATVSLSPKNDSGIEGEAKIRRGDGSIRVALLLQGLRPKGSYPAHIHKGTCEAGGTVATALSEVSNSGNRMGTSSTTISASTVEPDTSYFIQAHLPNGTPAACGNVPAGAFGPAGGR